MNIIAGELEDGNTAPAGSITNSKGDYKNVLKVQITCKQEMAK